MSDSWSYLPGATGDAWERMCGDTGDAWERLSGDTGDAWERLIESCGGGGTDIPPELKNDYHAFGIALI